MRCAWLLIGVAGTSFAQTVDLFGKSEAEYAAEAEAEVARMALLEGEWPWKVHGYPGFVESIDRLAGPGAHDCGYFETGQGRQTPALHANVRRCVEEAIASGNPFKFGYDGLSVDAHEWKVIVRAPSGELWVVQMFQGGPNGDGKQHQVNRVCKAVRFFSDIRTIDEGCVEKSRGPLPLP